MERDVMGGKEKECLNERKLECMVDIYNIILMPT